MFTLVRYTVYVQIFEGLFLRIIEIQDFFAVFFSGIICYQPFSSTCIVIVFKNFEDLIFVDDKLSAKTVKITPLENLYVYSMIKFLTVLNVVLASILCCVFITICKKILCLQDETLLPEKFFCFLSIKVFINI